MAAVAVAHIFIVFGREGGTQDRLVMSMYTKQPILEVGGGACLLAGVRAGWGVVRCVERVRACVCGCIWAWVWMWGCGGGLC